MVLAVQDPLFFEPLAMERVWGGRRLESLAGKNLPPEVPIGELWEVVDRPEAQSLVTDGEFRGRSLNDLWSNERKRLFGAPLANHPSERFPLLVKLLDAREKLSVQVHPPPPRLPNSVGSRRPRSGFFGKRILPPPFMQA
jgi:mannose-6-phosphate isomerase